MAFDRCEVMQIFTLCYIRVFVILKFGILGFNCITYPTEVSDKISISVTLIRGNLLIEAKLYVLFVVPIKAKCSGGNAGS